MKKGKLWVVAPVFNDWDSAAELVDTLKSLNTDFFIKIVLVDDASSQYPIDNFRREMKLEGSDLDPINCRAEYEKYVEIFPTRSSL